MTDLFNVRAYVKQRGWYAAAIEAKYAAQDLTDVIEWLREEKQYDKSDRLRTIRDRLAKKAEYVLGVNM